MTKRFIYYDTETTGVRPGRDRIVEIAAYDPVENRTFCEFSNPECPIPPEITAITNITDDMVADSPPIGEVMTLFADFCKGDVVLVAHNNDGFDRPFLEAEFERGGLKIPEWIYVDSLKWARKYRNDLPRHSLQSLREAYGIEANQAHRALDDVIVLEKIFSRMVGDLSCEMILELLSKKVKITNMPFGKYAGKPIAEIPKDYINWLAKSGAFDKKENSELKAAIEEVHKL